MRSVIREKESSSRANCSEQDNTRRASILPQDIDVALRRLRRNVFKVAVQLEEAFMSNPCLSMMVSDCTGRLPIHELVLAVSRNMCPREKERINRLIRLALEQNPEAAGVPDPLGGWFPVHRALKGGGVEDELFPLLLPACSQESLCNVEDPEETIPLIRAIRTGDVSESVLLLLLEHGGPDSVLHRDHCKKGWNALHFACRHRLPISIVRRILDLAPECAKAKDVLGITPLHVAVLSRSCLGIIQLLLEYSDREVEDSLHRTPLSIALRIGQENSHGVLDELLANTPSKRLREYSSDKFVFHHVGSPAGHHYSRLRDSDFVREPQTNLFHRSKRR